MASLTQAQGPLQIRHHITHRGPILPFQMHAVHRRVRHQLHRLRLLRPRRAHSRVQNPAQFPSHHCRHRIVHHTNWALFPRLENGPLTRQQLQQHNPKPVNIALRSQHVQPIILRVDIPNCPRRLLGPVKPTTTLRAHQRKPEIRNPRVPILVQQYVRRFNVPVDYRRDCVAMEILNPAGPTQRYLNPHFPRI
ncbi:pleckstrin homology (PH) domain-containing protein [Striga asiatica]|uniref:Pleckstrin homology (PH) domain-containing protein n=1 Tax=Striga asiatica TaxID=4170 RepID=A0A5A7R3M7_STRAF|nr:pleckstrin homology (PH) domain-containing protein [Striga asiatica]